MHLSIDTYALPPAVRVVAIVGLDPPQLIRILTDIRA